MCTFKVYLKSATFVQGLPLGTLLQNSCGDTSWCSWMQLQKWHLKIKIAACFKPSLPDPYGEETLAFLFSRGSSQKWSEMKWSEVKVAQACPTLCGSIDYTVHGILQARTLEGVAFPFSRGSSQPRDQNPGLPRCRQIPYQLSHQGSLIFVKYQLVIGVWVYFWTLNSIPLVYMSLDSHTTRQFCNKFQNWQVWVLQLCFAFLRLFWLSGAPCHSVWICRLLWVVSTP